MKKTMLAIPSEELVNEYCPIVSNKFNFFMDLQELNGISYKAMYEGKLSKVSTRATTGFYMTKSDLAALVKVAKDFQDAINDFVIIPVEDTKKYRKAMQKFIDIAPFSERSVYKVRPISNLEYKEVTQLYKRIKDVCLRYNDLFIDNPF